MKHKWHDEIVAWAGGAEIEYWNKKLERWIIVIGMPLWNSEAEFRVYSEYMKPQPKEPKYLYMYSNNDSAPLFFWNKITPLKTDLTYQGKIPLIVESNDD